MANEINIMLTETGLTLVAKLFQGNTQTGSNISLTESNTISGYYFGNSPGSIANGNYTAIIQTNAGVIKGWGSISFINNKEVTLGTNVIPISELWQLQGLDSNNPMNVTPISRTTGGIDLVITGDGVNTTTVQRV